MQDSEGISSFENRAMKNQYVNSMAASSKSNRISSMKFIISFISFIAIANSSIGQIEEYVDFLQNPQLSAKNYILRQFEEHDMVILCERDHNELTQYDLYLDVIADPWFLKNVSNIFTETGSYSIRDQIYSYIHTKYENDTSREADLITICQNVNFYSSWHNYNYYYFLDQINIINSETNSTGKINLFPSDFEFNWEEIKTAEDYTNWRKTVVWVNDRDSIMAEHIIEQYEQQVTNFGKQKCLVILNNRHAFSKYVKNKEKDLIIPCTAAILMDKYDERATNIFVHNMGATSRIIDNKAWNPEPEPTPIQYGKWDAAFKILGYESIGFDFANSPFGEDSFDYWPFDSTDLRYKDYFAGYVYFLSLEKFKIVEGIPNYFKYNDFRRELVRRDQIFSESYNINKRGLSWYDRYDRIRLSKVYGINKSREIVNQWLKE